MARPTAISSTTPTCWCFWAPASTSAPAICGTPSCWPTRKSAQVDRDLRATRRVFQPDVAICSDIRCSGGRRIHHAGSRRHAAQSPRPARRPPGHHRIANGRRQRRTAGTLPSDAGLFQRLARRFPHNALVFDDNIVFAQSYFDVSDRNIISRIQASHRSATRSRRHRRALLLPRTAPPSPSSATAASRCAAWK